MVVSHVCLTCIRNEFVSQHRPEMDVLLFISGTRQTLAVPELPGADIVESESYEDISIGLKEHRQWMYRFSQVLPKSTFLSGDRVGPHVRAVMKTELCSVPQIFLHPRGLTQPALLLPMYLAGHSSEWDRSPVATISFIWQFWKTWIRVK